MEEHCKNPWNKKCNRTDIVLDIMYKGEARPICAECWIKLAKGTREWGEGDVRPPFDAKVVVDETGMAIFGKLRVEDKKDKERVYTWQKKEHHCSRCKTTKPIDQFYIKKSGVVNAWCKECSKEYSRTRRKHPRQDHLDGLLAGTVKILGLEGKGYVVRVTGQLTHAYGNAQIWDMFKNKKLRIIKISGKKDRGGNAGYIDTIIHEIAHFEHLEKVMIEDNIKFPHEYEKYLKGQTLKKSYPNYFHIPEFYVILDELKVAYKRSTVAG